MAEILDYSRPDSKPGSKLLSVSANATLLYPLFVGIVLYGEWFVAWLVLGHPPRPSLDDPKDIVGSSLIHNITLLALAGMLPVALAALVLNVMVAIKRLSIGRSAMRLVVLITLWLAMFTLLRWDPGQVVYWWFD